MRVCSGVLAVGALAVAGCGTTTKTVTETTPSIASAPATSAPTTAQTTTPAPTGPPSCSSANVAHARAAGMCATKEGKTLHYAPRALPLRLKTLIARVEGVHATGTVSNGGGISATANGEYVIVSLNITNTTNAPEEFDGVGGKQTALVANERTFTEAFKAENEADQESFVTNSESIQPGESKTGDVIFDVPAGIAHKVLSGEKGGIVIANFGEDLSNELPEGTGVISLER